MENLHIRINGELADKLRQDAAKEFRTLNKQIEKTLIDYYKLTQGGKNND